MTAPQDPWQNPDPQWQQTQSAFPQQPPQPPPYGYGPGQVPQQPYPAYAGFPGYPGGSGTPTQRPPLPQTVRTAVILMFVGMGLALLNVVVALAQVKTVEDSVRNRLIANGTYTDTLYHSLVTGAIAIVVVAGLIGAGLWLWMALICRAGRNWGRIVSSVFFGIGCLGLLANLANHDVAAVNKLLSAVYVLVGLIVIILLWNGQSAPHFAPRQPLYPYVYGPGYGAGYLPGQAPYGQQPPYGQPGQPGQYGQQPPYGQG